MLFRKAAWPGLADGSITVAFRHWKRPSVKAGGTLRTAVGVLAIDTVAVVDVGSIDDATAQRAGFESATALVADLGPVPEDRELYRVEFRHVGEDPRVALRNSAELTDDELADVLARLGRLDRAASQPWTEATLRVIADHPGVVSTELAPLVGMERAPFKLNVRKLKTSGLTESLEVGYRISPRGEAVLRSLASG